MTISTTTDLLILSHLLARECQRADAATARAEQAEQTLAGYRDCSNAPMRALSAELEAREQRIATAERERDEATELAADAEARRSEMSIECGKALARAEAAERERDEALAKRNEWAVAAGSAHGDVVLAEKQRDEWKAEAEAAREGWRADKARSLANPHAGKVEAAERRLTEVKPGPATDEELHRMWYGTDDRAGHRAWNSAAARRAVYNLGRSEQAARVAELEAQLFAPCPGAPGICPGSPCKCVTWPARDAAWQSATGAATPGEVRRREPDWDEMRAVLGDKNEVFALGGTIRRCRGVDEFGFPPTTCDRPVYGGPTRCWRCCGIYEERQRLTARIPVVLPAAEQAAPVASDEEIARDMYDATNVPGSYDDIPWAEASKFNRALWTAAVAKVRAKLARPAQTCPQCDAPEIHCAGCGTATTKAWTCYDCAAGDRGVEPGPGPVITDIDRPTVAPVEAIEDDREPPPALVEMMRARPRILCRECKADITDTDGKCFTICTPCWDKTANPKAPPVPVAPAPLVPLTDDGDVVRGTLEPVQAFAVLGREDTICDVTIAPLTVDRWKEQGKTVIPIGIVRDAHLGPVGVAPDQAEALTIAFYNASHALDNSLLCWNNLGTHATRIEAMRRALASLPRWTVSVEDIKRAVAVRNTTEPMLVLGDILTAHIGATITGGRS